METTTKSDNNIHKVKMEDGTIVSYYNYNVIKNGIKYEYKKKYILKGDKRKFDPLKSQKEYIRGSLKNLTEENINEIIRIINNF